MSTLALAPSAPAPTAAGIAGNAGAAGEPASDATSGSSFATVLQDQLAAQILMPPPPFVELPAVDSAAEAPADTLLPMLLGMTGMTSQSVTSDAGLQASADTMAEASADTLLPMLPALPQLPTQPEMAVQSVHSDATENSTETGTLPIPTADATTAVPLALPATGIQPGEGRQKVGAGDTPHDRPTATSAANASAILAATAEAGARSALAAGKAEDRLAAVAENTAALRAEAMPQAQTAQVRAAEHVVRIEAPLGTRQWDGEFANRLAWMVGKNEQRADLVLTPPQLGRIEVSVSVNGEQATAIFTSASATVRDAIENALPRLREVLQESGINLGQAQVGSESPRQSPPHDENRDNRGSAVAADAHAMPPGFATNSPTAWLRGGRGIIDVFA